MLKHASHNQGAIVDGEILYETPFDYLFPKLARDPERRIVANGDTQAALEALGDAMADPGTADAPAAAFDSQIPAVFTYLGQFIDHDITARTDRDGTVTVIGDDTQVGDPDVIVANLKNGRRPQLDLDSVYGDGPGLLPGSESLADELGLFRPTHALHLQREGLRVDLPRQPDGTAIIADGRNDENVIISQLHAAFLAFHNVVMARQHGSPALRYIRARQLVRWAFQYIVINEYLPAVCHPAVVADVVANGPRFIGDTAGHAGTFMPLEFSVAAFRFAHSMIRPFYVLNSEGGEVKREIDKLFFPGRNPADFLGANGMLKPEFRIDWERFIPDGASVQFARRFDPRLSLGLFDLNFDGEEGSVFRRLAVRNLLRSLNLCIPTGQAVAEGLGFKPLTPEQLTPEGSPKIAEALQRNALSERTPLWFYVLQEAALQTRGQTLGEVGSRLVAETLVSLVKNDPNSYLNNKTDEAVSDDFIDVLPGQRGRVATLADMLETARVL